MCVAPEGLLTDHMSKGGLIGGTIEDYRLSHKETKDTVKNKRLYSYRGLG